MLKLYYAPKTRAARVRWMLEELGVPYELARINLMEKQQKTAEYLKVHPHGVVPALADDGMVMFESAAICLYLADKFSEKGLAPPPQSVERAKYYQWSVYAMATFEQPVLNYFYHTMRFSEDKRSPMVAAEAKDKFYACAEVLNNELWGKNFLLGNELTTPDILIGSLLNMAKAVGLPLDYFSQLGPYRERLTSRPAFKRSIAD